MSLSGGSGESMRAESGPSEASAAPFGPSFWPTTTWGWATRFWGVEEKRTSWATQLGICAAFGGKRRERVNTLLKGPVPAKKGWNGKTGPPL